MVVACRNRGFGIKTWCEQNDINYKTYYYRQRRVFEALPESANKQLLAFPSATETVTSFSYVLHLYRQTQ